IVSADVAKMKIAFTNIIVNAIESMEPGEGVLTLITRTEKDKCIIEITKNGTGMDEESQARLFEPYFTNKPKGNGLGLTNTQNIILSHKGKISIQSKPGKGSVFTVILKIGE